MYQGSLMEIWKSGVKIPFVVEHPCCRHNVVITRYNWVEKHFEGYYYGGVVELSPDWFLWNLIREA